MGKIDHGPAAGRPLAQQRAQPHQLGLAAAAHLAHQGGDLVAHGVLRQPRGTGVFIGRMAADQGGQHPALGRGQAEVGAQLLRVGLGKGAVPAQAGKQGVFGPQPDRGVRRPYVQPQGFAPARGHGERGAASAMGYLLQGQAQAPRHRGVGMGERAIPGAEHVRAAQPFGGQGRQPPHQAAPRCQKSRLAQARQGGLYCIQAGVHGLAALPEGCFQGLRVTGQRLLRPARARPGLCRASLKAEAGFRERIVFDDERQHLADAVFAEVVCVEGKALALVVCGGGGVTAGCRTRCPAALRTRA